MNYVDFIEVDNFSAKTLATYSNEMERSSSVENEFFFKFYTVKLN